jgi:hypothetical protein
LNAEQENENTRKKSDEEVKKARRESGEHQTMAAVLAKKLEDEQKKLSKEKAASKKLAEKLEANIKDSKVKFDILSTKLQRNCDELLDEFKHSCTEEKEAAVADAIKTQTEQRLKALKDHGIEVRRLESELFKANREVNQMQVNLPAMLISTRKEVEKEVEQGMSSIFRQERAEMEQKMLEEKAEAEKALQMERDEHQLTMENLEALEESLDALTESQHTAKFSSFAKQCVPPDQLEKWGQYTKIDSLGKKAATVAHMGHKSRKLTARILLMILNTVIGVAKAGTPDNEGMMDEIKKLKEFTSSPLTRLAGDVDSKDGVIKKTLAKAYKCAVRSNDKVL